MWRKSDVLNSEDELDVRIQKILEFAEFNDLIVYPFGQEYLDTHADWYLLKDQEGNLAYLAWYDPSKKEELVWIKRMYNHHC